MGTAKRAALVAEAYGGKALGGLFSLVTLPLKIQPPFPKKRLTDTYLSDPHVTNFVLPSGEPPADAATAAE
jgi:hypothetical protein